MRSDRHVPYTCTALMFRTHYVPYHIRRSHVPYTCLHRTCMFFFHHMFPRLTAPYTCTVPYHEYLAHAPDTLCTVPHTPYHMYLTYACAVPYLHVFLPTVISPLNCTVQMYCIVHRATCTVHTTYRSHYALYYCVSNACTVHITYHMCRTHVWTVRSCVFTHEKIPLN